MLFVEAVEVGHDVASEKGVDVKNIDAEKIVMDKKVVEKENVKQFRELQTIGENLVSG